MMLPGSMIGKVFARFLPLVFMWTLPESDAPGGQFAPHGPTASLAEAACVRAGLQPYNGCISWDNSTCLYDADITPEPFVTLVQFSSASEGSVICGGELLANCVNATNSARVRAATACLEEHGDLFS
jgi:hypothetical protein